VEEGLKETRKVRLKKLMNEQKEKIDKVAEMNKDVQYFSTNEMV
jgi:hypothetical protein